MNRKSSIYVAGHRGMVGSAIVRKLLAKGYTNLILKSSSELDLRDQAAVASFFASEQPEYVFLAAARVGGIIANSTRKGEFIYDNLMIETNVIHEAWKTRSNGFSFWAAPASIPSMPPSRSRRNTCLAAPLSRPTMPTPLPKSPASTSAVPTTSSTAPAISPLCPTICTAQVTTMT